MAKQVSKKNGNGGSGAVVPAGTGQVPAHLRGGKQARVGNIDQSDLIIPRIKLLQSVSPEVEQYDNAVSGQFWHTIAGESLGTELNFVPIIVRKGFVLWAPRNDDRGILARSSDGIKWDQPDQEFRIKPKNYPKEVTWRIGRMVSDYDMDKFGSSIPEDPNSPPAAALTYQIVVVNRDHPEHGLAILLNTRSSVKPAKSLISKIELKPVDHFGQQYIARVTKDRNNSGDEYWNYDYISDGFVQDPDEYESYKAMYDRMDKLQFRASDERQEEMPEGESGGGNKQPKGPRKY